MQFRNLSVDVNYLLYPSARTEDGWGHIFRMYRLHKDLPNSALYIPETDYARLSTFCSSEQLKNNGSIDSLQSKAVKNIFQESRIVQYIPKTINTCIVLDLPWIELEELFVLQKHTPLIAIDIGGIARYFAHFLIDTLPYPGYKAHARHFKKSDKHNFQKLNRKSLRSDSPNLYHPSFCSQGNSSELPPLTADSTSQNISFLHSNLKGFERAPATNNDITKILLRFGGRESLDEVQRFISHLNKSAWLKSKTGSIIIPPNPLSKPLPDLPENWCYIPMQESLLRALESVDLFISSYGLSAWEALFAGYKTLVIPSSNYHKNIAQLSGFSICTIENINQKTVEKAIPNILARIEELQNLPRIELSSYLKKLCPNSIFACPCCGQAEQNSALYRNSHQSFFLCSKCDTIYVHSIEKVSTSYNEEYFFADYKKQYGKTYLQDFENIKNRSKERLSIIHNLLSKRETLALTKSGKISRENQQRSLDIGAAYGSFVQAAKEAGFLAEGVEINQNACAYITSNLGLVVWQGDIRNRDFREQFSSSQYDLITMWYVIEHFPDLGKIFSWIYRMLKPGGIFAYSTPSYRGISGRKSLTEFLEQSPSDHYTIWSPQQSAKVSAIQGLSLVKIRSVGHHPERFPHFLGQKSMAGIVEAFSKLFALGDGLEVYLVKCK